VLGRKISSGRKQVFKFIYLLQQALNQFVLGQKLHPVNETLPQRAETSLPEHLPDLLEPYFLLKILWVYQVICFLLSLFNLTLPVEKEGRIISPKKTIRVNSKFNEK
jgi:hypothetical protein